MDNKNDTTQAGQASNSEIENARVADWHRLMHEAGWTLEEDGSYMHGASVLTADMVLRRIELVAKTGDKYVPKPLSESGY